MKDPASAPLVRLPRSLRERIGLGVLVVGGLWVLAQTWQLASANPVIMQALIGGSIAAMATALGTVPVMFSQRLSDRVQDTLFGFGAGVMLAACAFSLVIPGLEAAKSIGVFGGGRVRHELQGIHRQGNLTLADAEGNLLLAAEGYEAFLLAAAKV